MSIQIHNAATGEITIEPISEDEAAYIALLTQAAADKAAQEAQAATDKANATAKLEALGLTADDLKALGL